MARKRVVEAPSLHSWEDVNDALRQIAEAQIALGEIQSDMQKQILGAQKVAEEQSKPLNDKASKAFMLDAVIDEDAERLTKDMEENPGIAISIGNKLTEILGLTGTANLKKL